MINFLYVSFPDTLKRIYYLRNLRAARSEQFYFTKILEADKKEACTLLDNGKHISYVAL